MAVAIVILVFSAFVMGSYVYVLSPANIELSMISEHDESRVTGTTMILCPSKAREMGLCNTDERYLHAEYTLRVAPPPPKRGFEVLASHAGLVSLGL